MSCPLQLACKSLLNKGKGRQLVRYLVSHGANLDYVDHALRNAFYWSLYNHCGETACFLLQAGTWPKPWKWVEDEALPAAISSTPGKTAIKSSNNNERVLHWDFIISNLFC